MVDDVLCWDDDDDSASGAIFKLMATSGYNCDIVFANGGDRTKDNIPEMKLWSDKVEFVFGVGGSHKQNSSSWILEEYKHPKTKRNWGWYRVLDDKPGYKVKELVISPKSKLSMQRHFKRSEHWYVLKGSCDILTDGKAGLQTVTLKALTHGYDIGKEVWHQGINETVFPSEFIFGTFAFSFQYIKSILQNIGCIHEDLKLNQVLIPFS